MLDVYSAQIQHTRTTCAGVRKHKYPTPPDKPLRLLLERWSEEVGVMMWMEGDEVLNHAYGRDNLYQAIMSVGGA